jgi:hypothetical protein
VKNIILLIVTDIYKKVNDVKGKSCANAKKIPRGDWRGS